MGNMKVTTKLNRKIWTDENYVKGYELAKAGMSMRSMATAMGVSTATFEEWTKKKPAFKKALDDGRAAYGRLEQGDKSTFFEYVYERLPPRLKPIWDEIEACENEPSQIKRIEALLEQAGLRARQHLFIHAFVSSNFNISRACSALNTSYETFRAWCKQDERFAELVDEIQFHKKNFFEECLVRLVASGDTAATIFVNKTMNRDRGYNDKQEVQISGAVEHKHSVSFEELDLPLDVMKQVLEAMRMKKAEPLGIAGPFADQGRVLDVPSRAVPDEVA